MVEKQSFDLPVFCAITGKLLSNSANQLENKSSNQYGTFVLKNQIKNCYYFYDPSISIESVNDLFNRFEKKTLNNLPNDVDDMQDTKGRVFIKASHLKHAVQVLDEVFNQCSELYNNISHRKDAMHTCLNNLLDQKLGDLSDSSKKELEEIGEEFREFQKKFSSADDIIQLMRSTKDNALLKVTNEDEQKIKEKYEVVIECLKIEKYILKAVKSSEEKVQTIQKSEESEKLLHLYESIVEVWEKIETWTPLKEQIVETIGKTSSVSGELPLSNFEITLDTLIEKAHIKYNLLQNSMNELMGYCIDCNIPLSSLMKELNTLNLTIETCLHSVNTYKEGVNLLRRLRFLSTLPNLYQISMHEVVRRKQQFKAQKLENDTMNTVEQIIWINCQLENEKREEFEEQVRRLAPDPKYIKELNKLVPGLIGERVSSKVLVSRVQQFMTSMLRSVDSGLPDITKLEDIEFFVSSPNTEKNNALGDTVIIDNDFTQSMLASTMTRSTLITHVVNKLPEVNRHIDEQLEHIKQLETPPKEEVVVEETPIQKKHQEISEFYSGLMAAAANIPTCIKTKGREVELEAEILKLRNELDSHRNLFESLKYQLKEEQRSYQEQLNSKTIAYNKIEKDYELLKSKYQEMDKQMSTLSIKLIDQDQKMREIREKANSAETLSLELDQARKELQSMKDLRIKQGNDEVRHLATLNDQLQQAVKQLQTKLTSTEEQAAQSKKMFNKKIEELQASIDNSSETSVIQLKVIATLKDSLESEKKKLKKAEQDKATLKTELEKLKEQIMKEQSSKTSSSGSSSNKQEISIGDSAQFSPVKIGGKIYWQAATRTNKYFLSPETIEALQSYYQDNFQNQHTLVVNVIELNAVNSMNEQENPYQFNFPHSLVTGYIL
ncbi:predicted protein [Naegleria gruberi]|uniref:Predicted protein n=1 Tax=Naegleria gruberi TaxID=5762 RepID=D2VZD7_NAEGR|nr:uncharacterized protein NAEGRDRAFT_81815 [Naegleria gruberi]EFC37774.1 predicted protein [Naegleria gruberi]|eukprot:XP_002670518.1 predicted protein [Naegleria gruberi strain NEG-M]